MVTHKGTQDIKTERLLLRKIMPDDAEMMYKWMSDPDVIKYEDWTPHQNAEYTRGYIIHVFGNYTSVQSYNWGIQLDDELIGHIVVVDISDRKGTIGYYLRKDYWSKGYMTEAVRAIIKYMLFDVGIEKIDAKHSVNNIPSGKVLKKVGMVYKGHVKEVYFSNFEWQDCDYYSIIKEEYLNKYNVK
jgi:ribosomal-protein-alanine N-acetyltransferase